MKRTTTTASAIFLTGLLSAQLVIPADGGEDKVSEHPSVLETVELSEITPAQDKTELGGEEEEIQAQLQDSDEDLAGFVEDYIKKDSILKGAFFIEDPVGKKILKLKLVSVTKKSAPGPDRSKTVEAVFVNAAGGRHYILFHLRNTGLGEIDIYGIELKRSSAAGAEAKPGKPRRGGEPIKKP